MSYRLRMSAEIGDWLAEVTAAEPVASEELGAALAVLMAATELPGPPLVTDLAAEQAALTPDAVDPRAVVDYAYQEMLEALQHVRREVADAATRRRQLEILRDKRRDTTEELKAGEEELAAATRREEGLTARSQRLQGAVDAVRTAKETAKAMYTAAEARLNVHAAIAAVDSSGDLSATSGAESAAQQDEDEAVELHQALDAAKAKMKATMAQARRTLRILEGDGVEAQQRDPDDQAEDSSELAAEGGDAPVPGLLELRADPLGADLRVLFAVEPAATITLLAILDGTQAINLHRDEAIALAGGLLTEVRDGNWPPSETEGTGTGEVTFTDAETLLTKLFPDRGTAIRARAAQLAELGTFAGLRRARQLSIAEVAASAGLAEHRVWEIEHAGPRSVELHEAAAYLRALGGRLDLTATFGSGERTSLS